MSQKMGRVKHYLWHGNVDKALECVGLLLFDLDVQRCRFPVAAKLERGVTEFDTYIRNNQNFIPNFGERYRQGDTISTAFVESTINQVVSKRFVKKQQMQWSQKGAHLLLQTRTKVLDGDLDGVFRGWYPQFRPVSSGLPDPLMVSSIDSEIWPDYTSGKIHVASKWRNISGTEVSTKCLCSSLSTASSFLPSTGLARPSGRYASALACTGSADIEILIVLNGEQIVSDCS